MTPKRVVKRNGDRTKRVKERRRKCVCEWCGVTFLAARYDATTCSDAHRLLWSRWRKRFAKLWNRSPAYGPRGDERRQFECSST